MMVLETEELTITYDPDDVNATLSPEERRRWGQLGALMQAQADRPQPPGRRRQWIARDFQRDGGFNAATAPARAAYLAGLGFTVVLQTFPLAPDWTEVGAFLDIAADAGLKGAVSFIAGPGVQFTPSLTAGGAVDLGPIGELLRRYGEGNKLAWVSLVDEPAGAGMKATTLALAHAEAKRLAPAVPTWIGLSGEIEAGRWQYALGQSDLVLVQHLLAKYDNALRPGWNWDRFTAVQTESRRRIGTVNPRQPIVAGVQVKGVRRQAAEVGQLRPVTAAEFRQQLEYVLGVEAEAILPTAGVWIQGTDGDDVAGRLFGLSSPDAAEHRAILQELGVGG